MVRCLNTRAQEQIRDLPFQWICTWGKPQRYGISRSAMMAGTVPEICRTHPAALCHD